MAKYERVEFSKEKPKKKGWYYVTSEWKNEARQCPKGYWNGNAFSASDVDAITIPWTHWFRRIRPTTGLTAVQALKAMQRGECVEIENAATVYFIYRWNGQEYQRWLHDQKWHPMNADFKWFMSHTFSIVPDPSKEPEPEREEVDFFAMVKGCFEGKKYRTADGMNTFSSKTPGILCMGDSLMNLSSAWLKEKFYEVKE